MDACHGSADPFETPAVVLLLTALSPPQILSDLLTPINAGRVVVGGGGVDIGPMNVEGVPVSATQVRAPAKQPPSNVPDVHPWCLTPQVLDPRASNYASNPCLGPWWTDAVPGAGQAPGISDGYFWCVGGGAAA